jgi:hypothetical protein
MYKIRRNLAIFLWWLGAFIFFAPLYQSWLGVEKNLSVLQSFGLGLFWIFVGWIVLPKK